MQLFVGPRQSRASDYARHRHNLGFMAVEAIAERYRHRPVARASFQRRGSRRASSARAASCCSSRMTYMNEVRAARSPRPRGFLKIPPADIIVLHDELDLAAGKVRAKLGGGVAGHNGLRSLDCLPRHARLLAGADRHRPSRRQGARDRPCARRLPQGRAALARASCWTRSPMRLRAAGRRRRRPVHEQGGLGTRAQA